MTVLFSDLFKYDFAGKYTEKSGDQPIFTKTLDRLEDFLSKE